MQLTVSLVLLVFTVATSIGHARWSNGWHYSHIDKVLEARKAVDLGPVACIKAAKDELTELSVKQDKTSEDEAKMTDLKLFISLDELTKPESCGRSGSEIMRNNELKLNGRQWLARLKWDNMGPTERVVVHFANQHAELCQAHYLDTFGPKWDAFEKDKREYVEALTTPLIDAFTPILSDPEQQKLAGEVKSWTMDGEQDPAKRTMYNRKAVGFQSVNTDDAADIMRQVIIRLAEGDPQVSCLRVGAAAKLKQTLDRLTFRHKCDLEQILERYVYQPCRQFLHAMDEPLEFVSYDLLLSKQVMRSQDEKVLDMHLAAGRARICHLLSEHDHQQFIFNLLRMTGNLPTYYYIYGRR